MRKLGWIVGVALGLFGCNGGGDHVLPILAPGGGGDGGPTTSVTKSAFGLALGGHLGGLGAFLRPNGATDAGAAADAGMADAGTPDAGGIDAGQPDAGAPPPSPWPNQPVTVYGSANGIQELPVVGAQPDEAQNIWLVTHSALYLLKPGETTFHRYTDADGLHLSLSTPPGITAVAGGAPGEAFVGYEGYDTNDPSTMTQAQRDMGKLDRVNLNPDGTISVFRFNVHDTVSINYWENHSVRRLLYDHDYHPGNLYAGFNHGVDRIRGNDYVDHIHVEVCTGGCATNPDALDIGEWRGLAFDPNHGGALWTAGEYSAGLIGWTADLMSWIDNGANPFIVAFGDPYPPFAPVFEPPAEGDSVNLRAVAVAPDGLVWFASGEQWSPATDPMYGIASYRIDTGSFSYYDPTSLGFGTNDLLDLVALPDGRLVFGTHDGLRVWTPPSGAVQSLTMTDGLPGNDVQMMYLDASVTPPALYVGTDGGLAVLRIPATK